MHCARANLQTQRRAIQIIQTTRILIMERAKQFLLAYDTLRCYGNTKRYFCLAHQVPVVGNQKFLVLRDLLDILYHISIEPKTIQKKGVA